MQQLIERQVDVETGEIEIKPFEIGPTGLVVNGKPTFKEWYDFGLNLREIKTAVQWAVGDWINYGEEHYPDRYAQAQDETKYAYGTLRNYASIAARVDCHTRVTGLSWSHHAAVAALPADQQTEVLMQAKTERLSRDDLKPIVKKKLGGPSTMTWQNLDTITCQVSEAADRLREAMVSLGSSAKVKVSIYIEKAVQS